MFKNFNRGDALRNLKGPIFIVFGICILVIWFYPIYYITDAFWYEYPQYKYPKTASSVVIATLRNIPGTFLQTPWSFVAVVGLVVIGIGIYHLVRSLLRSRS